MRVIFHLPGVMLVDGGAALGCGRVEHLSFDEWQSLDPSFQGADRKYARARPVFWIGNLDVDNAADQEQILDRLSDLSRKIHCAFLLEPRVPYLPSPALSVRYVQITEHPDFPQSVLGMITRLIGPAEYEWVVFGSPVSIPYDAAALTDVGHELASIERDELELDVEGVRAGIATLERTARPDTWWGSDKYAESVNDFVHCMATCESILVADERKKQTLTDTFGRHAAAITIPVYAHLVGASQVWADLYRLRSRLVHGRLGLRDLDASERGSLIIGRRLLRVVIKAAIALRLKTVPGGKPRLPSLLAEAFRDPAAHVALHERLSDAS